MSDFERTLAALGLLALCFAVLWVGNRWAERRDRR